jgi:membrane protease YdiL (CAAX protease family)
VGGFDVEGWRAVARAYAGLGAGFVALSMGCILWGGPFRTAFAVIAGLSAVLALTAAAGFRQLAPGGNPVHADMAQFGWGLLNLVWTALSVLMPVAVCVWLFVMDEEFQGQTLRTGVALPVFLVFSALVRRAHRLAAKTFDKSIR